jgi:DnaJ-class molecular chaperone
MADIPETVSIGVMAEDYEPAEMPHRKIVTSMLKKIDGNKLAAYFHQEKGTFCTGCHHNAPPAKKPPKCASCHGKPFDPLRPDMPGLKAIYHDQCIGCHNRMGVEKPAAVDCIACHKEKKQ